MALYSGVLTNAQMTALIPEPATATLSLLALAGLAGRRRRR
ncbi:MAG: PEP-CTERM sorting domain-containing protein [Akkermansia sp.]|nr:PEP-CTERM sorting domain-containing protein [Akkermansia sp.]